MPFSTIDEVEVLLVLTRIQKTVGAQLPLVLAGPLLDLLATPLDLAVTKLATVGSSLTL